MKTTTRFLLSLVLALPVTVTVAAPDPARGKALHDEHCTHCHVSMMGGDGSGIYTRPDRRIESLPALRKQVTRCKNSLGMSWPEDQIDDLVAYLNQTYYKFGESR